VPSIFACGDVVGPYLFSHMAWLQASTAVRNMFIPWRKKIQYNAATWVIFSVPELASAGLTEAMARERFGESIRIFKVPYTMLDRAYMDQSTIGLGKFICDTRGRILGAHIIGARAGELISEIQVGKRYSLRLEDFFSVVHPYPTYGELIWKASKIAYVERLQRSLIVRSARWLVSIFNRNKIGV